MLLCRAHCGPPATNPNTHRGHPSWAIVVGRLGGGVARGLAPSPTGAEATVYRDATNRHDVLGAGDRFSMGPGTGPRDHRSRGETPDRKVGAAITFLGVRGGHTHTGTVTVPHPSPLGCGTVRPAVNPEGERRSRSARPRTGCSPMRRAAGSTRRRSCPGCARCSGWCRTRYRRGPRRGSRAAPSSGAPRPTRRCCRWPSSRSSSVRCRGGCARGGSGPALPGARHLRRWSVRQRRTVQRR